MSAHSNKFVFLKLLWVFFLLVSFFVGAVAGFTWSVTVYRPDTVQTEPSPDTVQTEPSPDTVQTEPSPDTVQTEPSPDIAQEESSPYQETYDLLVAATEGTTLHECILQQDSFVEGHIYYGGGRPSSYIAPEMAGEKAVELLDYCSWTESERLYNEADPRLPEPYSHEASDDVLDQLPSFDGDQRTGHTDCVAAATSHSDQLTCIVDSFVEYEANIEQIVAEDDELSRPRWDAWSAYWSNTSVSAPVVKAMDSIRGEMDAQGDRSARQAYIAQEICMTDGEWREASLRVAVERRAAESGEEPGIAANAVYGEYFGKNPYGQYGDYGACSDLAA